MASTSERAAPYVVTGLRRNGRVTYLCATAEWALRKREDFVRVGYTDIVARGPGGRPLDEQALRDAVARAGADEPVAG